MGKYELTDLDRENIEFATTDRETYDEETGETVSEVVHLECGYAFLEGWPDGSWSVHTFGVCLGVYRDGSWHGSEALYGG